jgi:hypothetical protein
MRPPVQGCSAYNAFHANDAANWVSSNTIAIEAGGCDTACQWTTAASAYAAAAQEQLVGALQFVAAQQAAALAWTSTVAQGAGPQAGSGGGGGGCNLCLGAIGEAATGVGARAAPFVLPAIPVAVPLVAVILLSAAIPNDTGPRQPLTVYRVYGGDSRPAGPYWTTADPRTASNYREQAGLPSGNTGEFLATGQLHDFTGVEVTSGGAAPNGAGGGGWPEIRVPDPPNQITITRIETLNPPY